MKTIIRGLQPDDMDRYTDLCVARGLDREKALLRAELVAWLAFENPTDDGKPCYFVAETGDKITGHMGRMPTEFFAQGRRHHAAFMHDLFIHPDLQRAGQAFFVTMRLYRACEKACDSFGAMCWTNEINIKLQQVRKYHELWTNGHVHLLRADNKLSALDRLGPLAGAAKRLAKPLANLALGGIDEALTMALGSSRQVEKITQIDNRFDELAERIGPRMRIAPVKSSRYLRWKYTERPQIDVAVYGAVGAPRQLLGFVVLREPKAGSNTAHIGTVLELCAARDDERTIEALLGAAIRHYRDSGVEALECMTTDPAFSTVLRRMLFVPSKRRRPFFYCNGDKYDHPDALADITHWHHSMGDSEGPY